MDDRSKATLAEIVMKELEALTPQDKIFLKARSSYLNPAEKSKFESILEPKKAEPKPKN